MMLWDHPQYMLLMRTIKKGSCLDFWVVGVRFLLIAPFVINPAKTNDAVRSTTVYVTDETYKKILSSRFWVVGVRCLLIAPFVINPAKMPFFQFSLLYFNFKLLLLKKLNVPSFLLTWARSTENFGSIRCIVFAQLHTKIRKYSNYNYEIFDVKDCVENNVYFRHFIPKNISKFN